MMTSSVNSQHNLSYQRTHSNPPGLSHLMTAKESTMNKLQHAQTLFPPQSNQQQQMNNTSILTNLYRDQDNDSNQQEPSAQEQVQKKYSSLAKTLLKNSVVVKLKKQLEKEQMA